MRTATDFQRMGDEWRLMASDFRDAGKDYEAALCEFHARVRDDAVHLLMLDPTLVIDLDALTAGRNDRPEPGAFRGRAAPADGVHLLRADRIAPESVDYLEASTIPLRVVTLVVGLDGVGKSTVLYDRAARATRGQLAGKYRGEPVDVVIASSEDHSASVIVPRLMAAGADLTRVHVVKVQRDGLTGEIALPDDLDELDRVVRGVGARLLIVDPLVAHMPMSIDSHKAQHVRRVLAPLARLAEEAHLAVCAVVHFNGSPSTDVRSRISGSKALRDASRSVLVCGVDPSDESRHVVVQDKNSFGPKPTTGRAYRIEAREIEHGGETFTTSGVVWLGDVGPLCRACNGTKAATVDTTRALTRQRRQQR